MGRDEALRMWWVSIVAPSLCVGVSESVVQTLGRCRSHMAQQAKYKQDEKQHSASHDMVANAKAQCAATYS